MVENADTPMSRWGQASALVENVLFIQGGRTDQYNAFAYSSAPVNNDILYLPLNSSFDLSSPPWQYVAGSTGPAVAWHTVTPFDTANLLLFGGDAGPNGPIADPEEADSAALLDASNRTGPVWHLQSKSWADEPLRRIYHTACQSGGKIFLVGGEKTDGSGSAFSDHYVFDPSGPSFTQLPTTNGPPDLFGHASVMLPDGRLLVFGGYSPSGNTLLPFSNVWTLDTTQSSYAWTASEVANATLPSPRRGFAAAILDTGKVLIQGGADADMQNVFSDGWVLDTTQSPMSWTAVEALSQIGPRRDHFAVAVGSEVIIGFGACSLRWLPLLDSWAELALFFRCPYPCSPHSTLNFDRIRAIRACERVAASLRCIQGHFRDHVHACPCRHEPELDVCDPSHCVRFLEYHEVRNTRFFSDLEWDPKQQ